MSVIDAARAWLDQDPDPRTRAELQALIDDGETAELTARFDGRLQFGTAGLRGALGAGPKRMNRVIVAQAAAGLATYLLAHQTSGRPSAVIGYDARYNSQIFATDTAEIIQGAGVDAFLLPRHLPTPVLAFAIRHLGVSSGVMVTASHNPPGDNGYKVYLADSSQIVPPADTDISAAIDRVGRVDQLPRSEAYTVLGDEVAEAYVQAAAATASDGPRDIVAVYTAMHGVGRDTLSAVVERAGFAPLIQVAEQAEPDAAFPTVTFPNPEEPGAMDLAIKAASAASADLIVANDPDADRCAVGVRDGEGYRMLTGDQVGVLLGDVWLRRGFGGTYAASIVSSELLGRLAQSHGQSWQQTLTGFKWIGKIVDLAYGYEEALGYCVSPHLTRDKDGVTAILAVLDLAATLKRDGQTLLDRLTELYSEHGLHHTGQLSVRVDDLDIITNAMQTLRTSPPTQLGGLRVLTVDDLAEGYQGLPPTDGVRLGLEGNTRIICRPSGTEPKLKCYIEVVRPVGDSLAAARDTAATTLASITADVATTLDLPSER